LGEQHILTQAGDAPIVGSLAAAVVGLGGFRKDLDRTIGLMTAFRSTGSVTSSPQTTLRSGYVVSPDAATRTRTSDENTRHGLSARAVRSSLANAIARAPYSGEPPAMA